MPEYTIPVENFETLQKAVDVLNRRATRLGVEKISLKILRTEPKTYMVPAKNLSVEEQARIYAEELKKGNTYRGGNLPVVRAVHVIEVPAKSVLLNGWTFVATLDHTTTEEGVGVLLRCVPGETLPVEFRTSDTRCEHCNKQRVRRETFVLRHEDGTLKRVGRQCIADFLGTSSVSTAANLATWLAELQELLHTGQDEDGEGFGYGFGGGHLEGLRRYVAVVNLCIRKLGWLSGGAAFQTGKTPTREHANAVLNAKSSDKCQDWYRLRKELNEDDFKVADAAIEWARSLRESSEDLSDYLHNLVIVCSADFVASKNKGIAASLIPAYNREMEKQFAKRKLAAGRKHYAQTSQYVGKVGDRMKGLTLEVLRTRSFNGTYGATMLVVMADGQNVFQTFSSGKFQPTVGQKVTVDATVKGHKVDTYAEPSYKVTELTRVALKEVVEEAPKMLGGAPVIANDTGNDGLMEMAA